MNVPEGLLYTPTHEWVRIEGDVATIGITDYAQAELGDIVYVEVPTPGRVLAKGEGFTSVESVKTVSDVYAPAASEVLESNPALGAQAELLNTDPYGEGWIVKVRFTDGAPPLMGAEEYKAIIG